MNTFIETIRLSDSRLRLLSLHQSRMAATIGEMFGSSATVPSLEAALRPLITDSHAHGTFKCRIIYDTEIRHIAIEPYTARSVSSLKLVEASPLLDYHLKSADRSELNALAERKGECDEVVIVRNGLITDTSYTNLLFSSPRAGLLTPRSPLLKGTMRQHLIDEGLATESDLTPTDILPGNPLGITHAILINAMLPLDSAPTIPVEAIHH